MQVTIHVYKSDLARAGVPVQTDKGGVYLLKDRVVDLHNPNRWIPRGTTVCCTWKGDEPVAKVEVAE